MKQFANFVSDNSPKMTRRQFLQSGGQMGLKAAKAQAEKPKKVVEEVVEAVMDPEQRQAYIDRARYDYAQAKSNPELTRRKFTKEAAKRFVTRNSPLEKDGGLLGAAKRRIDEYKENYTFIDPQKRPSGLVFPTKNPPITWRNRPGTTLMDKLARGIAKRFHFCNSGISDFKVHTRTKLKFNPGTGMDVELPTPNPVTQYVPTTYPSTELSNEDSFLTNTLHPNAVAGNSVKDFPTASSVLRGTQVDKSVQTNPNPPVSMQSKSTGIVEAGKTKKEAKVASVNITGSGEDDSRKAMNPKTLGQSATKNASGLMNKNTNDQSYYRRILNAL
jgi:hypothetical protein